MAKSSGSVSFRSSRKKPADKKSSEQKVKSSQSGNHKNSIFGSRKKSSDQTSSGYGSGANNSGTQTSSGYKAGGYSSDRYGSSGYGSDSYGSASYNSHSYSSDSYGSGDYRANGYGSSDRTSSPYGTAGQNSSSYDSGSYRSGSYGADSYGSDSYGADSYGTDSYGAKTYNAGGYESGAYRSGAYGSASSNAGGYGSGAYGSDSSNAGGYRSGDGYGSGGYGSDNYNAGGYGSNGYSSDNYNSGTYNAGGGSYGANGYSSDSYGSDTYNADGYRSGGYSSGSYNSHSYSSDSYGSGNYSAGSGSQSSYSRNQQKEDFPFKNTFQDINYNEDDSQQGKKKKETGKKKQRKKNSGQPVNKGPKKKKKTGCAPILLIVILLVLALVAGLYYFLYKSFSKVEQHKLDESSITYNGYDKNMKKYQTIALFGVDDQDNKIHDIGSRTDSIMVACINKRTKKVKIMSIYRDTYVSIDGDYDKINAAYSYGGPDQAINTINRNLDLNIKDFATVNFKALADAVDILGGITLTIKSEKELENLNDYIGNMNKINGGDSPKFDKVGTYTFDGNQAVAYSRIRYMEGGDHARAGHQRLVVEGILKEAKKQPWKVGSLIDKVLPQCKSSLSAGEFTKMAMGLFLYDIEDSQAYPFDSFDEKYNGIYYGFPTTVESNVIKAHKYLFGTKNYEPSDELRQISEKVENIANEVNPE